MSENVFGGDNDHFSLDLHLFYHTVVHLCSAFVCGDLFTGDTNHSICHYFFLFFFFWRKKGIFCGDVDGHCFLYHTFYDGSCLQNDAWSDDGIDHPKEKPMSACQSDFQQTSVYSQPSFDTPIHHYCFDI